MKELMQIMMSHDINKEVSNTILTNTLNQIVRWKQPLAVETINVQIDEQFANGELVYKEVITSFRVFHPVTYNWLTICHHYPIYQKEGYIKLED